MLSIKFRIERIKIQKRKTKFLKNDYFITFVQNNNNL